MLVSDGRNWKKTTPKPTLYRLPRDMFSGLQMLNNRIAPMVYQACSELMWNVSFPVHFLAWWLSTTARPVAPASDMQRETRAAKWEENHKLVNPLKGASDGIHASCQRNESTAWGLQKQSHHHHPQNHTAKTHQKHTMRERMGKKAQRDFIQIWRKKSRGC